MRKPNTRGRHIRFPVELDKWLEREARQRGFRSLAEFVNDLARAEKSATESRQSHGKLSKATV